MPSVVGTMPPEITVVSGLVRTARPNHWVHNRPPFLLRPPLWQAQFERTMDLYEVRSKLFGPRPSVREAASLSGAPFAMRTAVLQANSLPAGQPLMRIKCADSHVGPRDRSNEVR